jgi:O-antigen ligase/tetratricopeptide (TPR) repeat protein
MIWIIASLIPLTALMMGAVHPWAYKALEETVLALAIIWTIGIAQGSRAMPSIDRGLRFPLVGLLLVLSLISLQLVPLPAQIERLVSPGTYRLYKLSLPGWPEEAPYAWLLEQKASGDASTKTPEKSSNRSQLITSNGRENPQESRSNPQHTVSFPISLAPSLTGVALLKMFSCSVLGVLIVLYPFPNGSAGTRDCYQALVRVILASGLVLGLVGLLEEFISNGKPLWIFNPYTFRSGAVWGARAFGPFADPDHYACFLAMLLPPTLSGIIFPEVLGKVRERAAVPLLSGVVTVVIVAALLATASRGGMLNAAVGVMTLIWLSTRLSPERLPKVFRTKRRKYLILGIGAAGLITLAVFLTGSSNQALANSRIKASFSSEGVTGRLVPAEDSVRMIADFPILGIGLGVWPELYRKYARPPWSPVFMNAAHDEYVQLLAEIGAIGFLLVAAIVIYIGHRTSLTMLDLPGEQFPVIASSVAALAGLAVHAVLDFPLRVPAIALFGTIMAAFVTRAAFQNRPIWVTKVKPDATIVLGASGIITVLIVLMLVVWHQPRDPYPYDLKAPQNNQQMVELLRAHPVNARVHMMLIGLMAAEMPKEKTVAELDTAVRLEPNNPLTRDMYLQVLARQGQNDAALDQMRKSVFRAPAPTDHFYLSPDWIPKLTPVERDAIEKGLQAAVKEGFAGAVTSLGDYYEEVGDFRKEAILFVDSAWVTRDAEQKAELLSWAGRSFARAGDYENAISSLQQSMSLNPYDPSAYEYLSLYVDVPRRLFESARAALNRGIEAGADPATLYRKLAEVNRDAKDKDREEEALKQVVELEPLNFEANQALGDAYLSDGHMDEAVLWLRKATQVNPSSAQAFFDLAQAEESDYQFSMAESDYIKAIALEPDNAEMQTRYQQFKERLATNRFPG